MNLIYKSGAKELKDVDDSKGIIKGIGSYFGNEDSDGDVMVKGCYTKSIQENLKRMRYLYQHSMHNVIGKFMELVETDNSLDFVAQLAVKTQLGKDVFELIKGGFIDENSVGFMTVKSNYDEKDGLNYITEAKLFEISAVTLAANPLATMEGYKSALGDIHGSIKAAEYIIERISALQKLVKSNISDDLGFAVEFEMNALKDFVSMLDTKSDNDEPTEQDLQEEATQPEPAEQEKQDDSHSEDKREEETKSESVIIEPTETEIEAINAHGIYSYLRENF